jgi:hypothetical protein
MGKVFLSNGRSVTSSWATIHIAVVSNVYVDMSNGCSILSNGYGVNC